MAGGDAGDRAGVSTGPNSRPLNDTVAETGAGVPDDAVLDGQLQPGELGAGAEAAVAALQRSGWAPGAEGGAPDDAEPESEAHPS